VLRKADLTCFCGLVRLGPKAAVAVNTRRSALIRETDVTSLKRLSRTRPEPTWSQAIWRRSWGGTQTGMPGLGFAKCEIQGSLQVDPGDRSTSCATAHSERPRLPRISRRRHNADRRTGPRTLSIRSSWAVLEILSDSFEGRMTTFPLATYRRHSTSTKIPGFSQ
jgi:hypothetical protein